MRFHPNRLGVFLSIALIACLFHVENASAQTDLSLQRVRFPADRRGGSRGEEDNCLMAVGM
ncbi:MAG TPA: hypothetical protein VJ810_36210 [Blastocatellia bacterium]|nr:hypothetical protein [Blastocatellia bacterium]